jgi:hypothetical protein
MKTLLFSLLFSCLAASSFSQNWLPVGPDNQNEIGFGPQYSDNLINDDDTLYACMVQHGYSAVIKKITEATGKS